MQINLTFLFINNSLFAPICMINPFVYQESSHHFIGRSKNIEKQAKKKIAMSIVYNSFMKVVITCLRSSEVEGSLAISPK